MFMSDVGKTIKKQNDEAFAQALRNHHNGLLEIPDIDTLEAQNSIAWKDIKDLCAIPHNPHKF